MGNYSETSSKVVTQYEWSDGTVTARGEHRRDVSGEQVETVNGTVSDGGQYVGDFSGKLRGEGMKYSLSEMTKEQSDKVWGVIADIEAALASEASDEGAEEPGVEASDEPTEEGGEA